MSLTGRESRFVLLRDLDLQPLGQLVHEPILQIEEIVDAAVNLDGRDLPAVGHLDDLRRDADALAQSLICAAYRDAGVQPTTELDRLTLVDAPPDLVQAPLQLEDLLARHDDDRLQSCQVGRQRFGNPLPDPVVCRVAGDVGEVQARQRSSPTASTRPAAQPASATRRPQNRWGSARR